MRFLFVDRITDLGTREIEGEKTFGTDAAMRYASLPENSAEISPAAVSEAVGQLVSWLCIHNNDFTARPVFLFADKILIKGRVAAGSVVELKARIDEMEKSAEGEGQTFVFSGEALVDGEEVHRIERCSGYFMPLAELEDPVVTRQRFQAMLAPEGLKLPGEEGQPPFPFEELLGEVTEESPGVRVVALKTFGAKEKFYQDHFPRFPVTPIVMINEMIGQAASRLILGPDGRAAGRRIQAVGVESIKIRNFVRPGETVETRITLKERYLDPLLGGGRGGEIVVTTAEVIKDGKPILRGRYTYSVS